MSTGRFIAYYRVSTAKQGASGLGLEAQREAVRNYLNGGNWTVVEEVTEVESGKRNDRPALRHALAMCRIHNAVLLVAKLDRLARNVAFIATLMEAGVRFVAVDLPVASDVTIQIMAVMAEYEAKAISARTKAALAAAKARGIKLGTPRPERIAAHSAKGNVASALARAENADKRASDLQPVIRSIQTSGEHSLRRIAAVLNEREIRTPRGQKWSAVQVQRVMKRA